MPSPQMSGHGALCSGLLTAKRFGEECKKNLLILCSLIYIYVYIYIDYLHSDSLIVLYVYVDSL